FGGELWFQRAGPAKEASRSAAPSRFPLEKFTSNQRIDRCLYLTEPFSGLPDVPVCRPGKNGEHNHEQNHQKPELLVERARHQERQKRGANPPQLISVVCPRNNSRSEGVVFLKEDLDLVLRPW